MTSPSSAAPPAIRLRNVWHSFGSIPVVRNVSFDVAPGEIFGFIGPNGAGKTTTIRIMATLLDPMAGQVEVDGLDVTTDPEKVRRRIGYMSDHAGVYERITVYEYLDFFAAAGGTLHPSVVEAVIELTELQNLRNQLVLSLSKGLRQRLQLARVLLHDPRILILDEPASDLDPRARIEIRDLLLELRELGKTIFLSSHILSELSDVCTSIGIIERGELLVAGPIGRIAEQLAEQKAVYDSAPREGTADAAAPPDTSGEGPASATPVTTAGGAIVPDSARRRVKVRVLGDATRVAPLITGGPGVLDVQASSGGKLTVYFTGDERFVAGLVSHLVANGVPIAAVEPERNELEQIFLDVTRGSL